jgi:hypothetical protein
MATCPDAPSYSRSKLDFVVHMAGGGATTTSVRRERNMCVSRFSVKASAILTTIVAATVLTAAMSSARAQSSVGSPQSANEKAMQAQIEALKAEVRALRKRLGRSAPSAAPRAATSAAVLQQPALAPTYAMAPADVPAPGWTGFYLGGNVGYGAANGNFSIANVGSLSAPSDLAVTGAIGGVQLGYNWQFNPAWLLGLEGDFQWAWQRGNAAVFLPNVGFPPQPLNSPTAAEAKLDWFSTCAHASAISLEIAFGTLPAAGPMVTAS